MKIHTTLIALLIFGSMQAEEFTLDTNTELRIDHTATRIFTFPDENMDWQGLLAEAHRQGYEAGKAEFDRYAYDAHVTEVYDGDTITISISLGLNVKLVDQKIRMFGINTPEIRGGTPEEKARGFAARDYLRALLLDKDIILQTHKDKDGKYGRLLGTIWIDGVNVNALLISTGHAVEYLP